MIWYWYLSGMATVILLLSMLANIGFAHGWLRYEKPSHKSRSYETPRMTLYDWADDSGPIARKDL